MLSIDGNVVRTITRAEAGANYPQTPMRVKLGTWNPGHQGNNQGTVDWAGGYTNFADGPFVAYYKKVVITDMGNGVSGASSYTYTDKSGLDTSIKIEGGSGSPNSPSASASASASASGTAAPTTLSTATTTSSPTSGASGPSGTAGGVSPSSSSSAEPPSQTAAAGRIAASNFALLAAGAIVGAML